MEALSLSNRKYLFVSLSIILHAALFGAGAVFDLQNRIAEDLADLSSVNKPVQISAVFRNNREAVQNGSLEKINHKLTNEYLLPETENKAEPAEIKEKLEADENDKYSKTTAAESENKSADAENSIAEGAVPETLTLDSFTTDLNPEYPKFARKNSYEGIVRVSLTINRIGKGENIHIIKSSGYSVLDKAALKAVKKASFKANDTKIAYIASALKRPLLVDIHFSLTQG